MVLGRFRAQSNAFDLDYLLTLLRLALFLLTLVDELAVVKNTAHGRIGIGRDLNQVEVLDTSLVQRVARFNDSFVAAICGNQTHMWHSNLLVDAELRCVLSSYWRYT